MNGIGMLDKITKGTDVYGLDGEKVGSVIAIQPTYVIVEKGVFFPTDYYVPTEAVTRVADGKVYLNVTKDQALNQAWDTAPPGAHPDATAVATGGGPFGTTGAGRATLMEVDAPFRHLTDNPDTHVDGAEKIRVPVHEEDLTAVTRQREVGEVRVEKEVIVHERTIEVPVMEERVRVARRPVDRPAGAADAVLEAGPVAEVPLRGEAVELQRRVRVAEEVELTKEQVERTERVTGTARREEVRISEEVAADTGKS